MIWVQADIGLPLLRIVEQETGYLIYYSDTLGNTLGINKNELNRSVQVYPNPFRDEIQVEMIGYKISKLSLNDINGRVVISQDGSNSSIETAMLPSGIYLLEIEVSTGERLYRKLLK
jgi:hypothetical protein